MSYDTNAFPEQLMNGRTKPGMTLRDWFAGQAMAGMLARFNYTETAMAIQAYKFADAMLKARDNDSEVE